MASLAAATTSAENNSPDSFSVNVTSCAASGFPGEPAMTDILVSIVPPAAGTRPPTDVCCVVDVSGSMGVECTNGDAESQGLSVLDVVKHACKTVLNCLTAQDRFSVVAYSTTATVKLPLINVDANGLTEGTAAITALEAGGQTNLWDGLHTGLKVLNDSEGAGGAAGAGRMKAVLLLTDGLPNITPPRGHVPMLQQYKEETDMLCTISTFGFGYQLDSKLLKEIATEGQGMYAFIPDGSFVGTAFVNATSNVLSMAARNVVLKVSGLSEAAASVAVVPGHSDRALKASWGLQIPLGSVHFGQNKDVVVALPADVAAGAIRADVEFSLSGSTELVAVFGEGPTAASDTEALLQGLRLRVVELMTSAVADLGPYAETNSEQTNQKRTDCAAHLKSVIDGGNADKRLADLLLDVDGQFKEAISRPDWYKKWGRHYLPSLACAHLLQQCNNFKDPGVQHYGGPLFSALRDTAEGIFIKLPPPEPSIKPASSYSYGGYRGGYGGGPSRGASTGSAPAARAAPVDMSTYYNAGGGCFTGDALVAMAEGQGAATKRVDELKAGDRVKAFRRDQRTGQVVEGAAVVGAVVETVLSSPALLVPLKSTRGAPVRLTPWHPVLLSSTSSESTTEWAFPAEVAAASSVLAPAPTPLDEVGSVFNLALLPEQRTEEQEEAVQWHGVELNGVRVITLAHGVANHRVASHAYYGTAAVLKDLAALTGSSTSGGRVVVSQQQAVEALDRHRSGGRSSTKSTLVEHASTVIPANKKAAVVAGAV